MVGEGGLQENTWYWYLGDGSNAAAHILKAEGQQVDAIQNDLALERLDHAEEGDDEAALAAASAAHDANLLAGLHHEGHPLPPPYFPPFSFSPQPCSQ